jgi:hypothetical protein
MFDFTNTSWGYGRRGVKDDTQILLPENITVNLGLLQILVNWNSFESIAHQRCAPIGDTFKILIGRFADRTQDPRIYWISPWRVGFQRSHRVKCPVKMWILKSGNPRALWDENPTGGELEGRFWAGRENAVPSPGNSQLSFMGLRGFTLQKTSVPIQEMKMFKSPEIMPELGAKY